MSEDDPIRIYVTHTFSDHPDHARVFEYLESATNFFYKNCSDPSQLPASGDADAVREELRKQIQSAEIMLVPGGMYDEHYDSLKFQMTTAKTGGVPMVALELFGGVGKVHRDVTDRVLATVSWNEREIVDAIKKYGRGEDTTRFETIEFEMP